MAILFGGKRAHPLREVVWILQLEKKPFPTQIGVVPTHRRYCERWLLKFKVEQRVSWSLGKKKLLLKERMKRMDFCSMFPRVAQYLSDPWPSLGRNAASSADGSTVAPARAPIQPAADRTEPIKAVRWSSLRTNASPQITVASKFDCDRREGNRWSITS